MVLSDVDKHFGQLHVLQRSNLTVRKGEVVVVLGPSGSGKSTSAGPSTGWSRSSLGPSPSTVSDYPRKARRWHICALTSGWCSSRSTSLPHKTILENVTLGPIKVRKSPTAEAEKRGMELLSASRSTHELTKYPGSAVWRPAAARGASPGRWPWIPR